MYTCFWYIESKTQTLVFKQAAGSKAPSLRDYEVAAPGEGLNFCP